MSAILGKIRCIQKIYLQLRILSKHFVDHLDTNTLTTKERMGKKVKRKERERGRESERERERERDS